MRIEIEQICFTPLLATVGVQTVYLEQDDAMIVIEIEAFDQLAKAIEAQRATTTKIGVVHESAAPKGFAQKEPS